jgi:hypothetical protein
MFTFKLFISYLNLLQVFNTSQYNDEVKTGYERFTLVTEHFVVTVNSAIIDTFNTHMTVYSSVLMQVPNVPLKRCAHTGVTIMSNIDQSCT